MANHKKFDKTKIDVSQCFLTFMSLVGDCDRTAAALDLEPDDVRTLAEDEGWNAKIRRVSLMSKSGKPGDFERATNRAINFVMAQCLRTQVNRLLSEVQSMSNEELLARACVRTKTGDLQLSAKFFTDIASAAESVHRLSYMALGDTVSERSEAEGGQGKGGSSNDLHAAIIASLSNPELKPEPITQQLINEANAEVQRRAAVAPRVSDEEHAE